MWAVLLLLYAYLLCIAAAAHESQINLLWLWVYLQATPLIYLLNLRIGAGIPLWIDIGIPLVYAAIFSIVIGLLINKLWARFLIVMGMSIWFFGAIWISSGWV